MPSWHTEGLFDFDPKAAATAPPATEPAEPEEIHYARYYAVITVVAHKMEPMPDEPSYMPPAEILEKFLKSALNVRMRNQNIDVF